MRSNSAAGKSAPMGRRRKRKIRGPRALFPPRSAPFSFACSSSRYTSRVSESSAKRTRGRGGLLRGGSLGRPPLRGGSLRALCARTRLYIRLSTDGISDSARAKEAGSGRKERASIFNDRTNAGRVIHTKVHGARIQSRRARALLLFSGVSDYAAAEF